MFINPWVDFFVFQKEMDKLLSHRHGRFPAVNIYQNDEKVIFCAEIPGVLEKNLNVLAEKDRIAIEGNIEEPVLSDNSKYQRQERVYGDFSRSFKLPFDIDSNNVKAEFKDGFLVISMPRSEQSKPKRISITSG
ncbi:Hsp20/alpha crystallin family protein [Lentisphaerota bacterium ZTH]|nr:Hsp20/alpha crystallin family protein [Lentisphaerota bacterium]WET05825.1 Hsp20/alpha crystallin family protein [Lentisphaerota bacterium ZTH]